VTQHRPAEAEAVLKALAKPKGVAVFIPSRKAGSAKPDPFYLGLMREDTIALVVEEKDWSPEEPRENGFTSVYDYDSLWHGLLTTRRRP